MNFHGIEVFTAGILTLGLCLVLHAFVMFLILGSQLWFRRRWPRAHGISLIMPSILLATLLIVVSSCLQILIWSGVLWCFGDFPSVNDAMYFSGTTYTTLGTGKHVLVPPYRVLEPLEATNGMLAAGLNTAILFSILSSMARKRTDYEEFFGGRR